MPRVVSKRNIAKKDFWLSAPTRQSLQVYSLQFTLSTSHFLTGITALQRYSVTLRIFHYADFQAREHY